MVLAQTGATSVDYPAKNAPDKEGDADVVATFEQIKTIIYVQAKHHKDETPDWAIQQIKDYQSKEAASDDGYTRSAWVVSTCDRYTTACQEAAKSSGVLLFDGLQFAEMILRAGIDRMEI